MCVGPFKYLLLNMINVCVCVRTKFVSLHCVSAISPVEVSKRLQTSTRWRFVLWWRCITYCCGFVAESYCHCSCWWRHTNITPFSVLQGNPRCLQRLPNVKRLRDGSILVESAWRQQSANLLFFTEVCFNTKVVVSAPRTQISTRGIIRDRTWAKTKSQLSWKVKV